MRELRSGKIKKSDFIEDSTHRQAAKVPIDEK
jgi:hypothetical protein